MRVAKKGGAKGKSYVCPALPHQARLPRRLPWRRCTRRSSVGWKVGYATKVACTTGPWAVHGAWLAWAIVVLANRTSSRVPFPQHTCSPHTREQTTRPPPTPGTAYLDHAGAGLYSATQVAATSAALLGTVYSNPHSASSEVDGGPGCRYIQAARERVLQLLGTTEEQYCVIFTVSSGPCLVLWACWARENECVELVATTRCCSVHFACRASLCVPSAAA
jgi:hypothetical protein